MVSKSLYHHLLLVYILIWWAPKFVTSDSVNVDVDGNAVDTDELQDDVKFPQTCDSWTGASCDWEPNLHPMTVQYGNGIYNETFNAYVIPDVSTFYNLPVGSKKPIAPEFNGQFGKFVNMSPNTVQVHWHSGRKNDEPVYIADIEPFGSAGTATYPNHKFVVTAANNNKKKILIEWTIQRDNALYYYDPYDNNPDKAKKALTTDQYHLYYIQIQTRAFAIQYRNFTGIDYLAVYKYKHPPRYHMWRADFINQTHTITSDEIPFVSLPPSDELHRTTSVYGPRPDELLTMRPYRQQKSSMELTLRVLSCAPRVFEIQNFLSDIEVDHILQIAHTGHMARSSTRAGDSAKQTSNDDTRTSKNTWIDRNHDLVIEIIHRRAANILQIPESLLRWRRTSEVPEIAKETSTSIAERLQLVHYDVGQQYTPHHDFSMPGLINGQPSRFATILFYLNDDMVGGETSFPRWLNSETSAPLLVKPERGKAILFYNMLPDGNYDERSQHAALPVLKGEKYLTNLWVWDPIMDHAVRPLMVKACRYVTLSILPYDFVNKVCGILI